MMLDMEMTRMCPIGKNVCTPVLYDICMSMMSFALLEFRQMLCRNWDKCSVATCRSSVQLRLSLSALCSSGILSRTLKICCILAPQESGLSSELWLRMDSPRPHAWCDADCYQCFFGAPLRSRSGNDLCLSLHRRASTSHSVSRPNPKCIQYLFRLPNTCRKVLATFPEGEPTTFHFWMQSQSLEFFQHAL